MTFDFPTAFASHGPEERAAAERVLRSDRLTAGPEVEAFEAELAAYCGRKHAVMTNSGSSANLAAVAALDRLHCFAQRGRGYAPAIAWSTTYAPLIQYSVKPAILDVDDTWNAPPPAVPPLSPAAWSGPFPQILGAVPVLGNPAHLPGWARLAGHYGVPLLVDACESLGAEIGGRSVVAYGDVATVSFFYSHQLSAYEGGAALTDDDDLARLMRLLVGHGNSGWGSNDFDASYRFELFGYNLRPVEMHAAIARVQLRRLPELVAARRANATLFREMTADLPIEHPTISGEWSPFGLNFTVGSRDTRRRLVAALRAASIDARLPTGGSFTRHPYGVPWREHATPRADLIHDTGLFLGCAPYPIPGLIGRATKVMRETL